MKRIILISVFLAFLGSSCTTTGEGELMGVLEREAWFEPDPYGMLFIPMGSFNMGPSDQDVPWAMTAQSKTVSISPYWMDETEITNNEYRQFVNWVRDSIAREKLSAQIDEYHRTEDEFGDPLNPHFLVWDKPILWLEDDDQRPLLMDMYYPENERFYRRREFDVRKFNFVYFWIDLKQAAQKFTFNNESRRRWNPKENKYDGEIVKEDGQKVPVTDRSSFIMKDIINVYPDTLCWISDFTYSYNEPMANMYFWHPAYDHYPVVGVSWRQARAFCIWRTQLKNAFLAMNEESFVQDFRLPTESEWEYGARGGLDLSMYPWGGLYTRNYTGCFIANFKPLRGNYVDDGGIQTLIVASYEPNEFGLYDMGGNVAEWTSNAFDESAYNFNHDLNPDYIYTALPDDPPALKRKVIRGGSWKDISYYLQTGTRTYEYQDTAKSYIGFRCVRSYLGRSKDDGGEYSHVY